MHEQCLEYEKEHYRMYTRPLADIVFWQQSQKAQKPLSQAKTWYNYGLIDPADEALEKEKDEEAIQQVRDLQKMLFAATVVPEKYTT